MTKVCQYGGQRIFSKDSFVIINNSYLCKTIVFSYKLYSIMRTVITFLGVILVCSVAWAQQGRYISGRITDAEDGEPVPAR